MSQTRTFGAMTRDLLALRDWLGALGVTLVGTESMGVHLHGVLEQVEDGSAWNPSRQPDL